MVERLPSARGSTADSSPHCARLTPGRRARSFIPPAQRETDVNLGDTVPNWYWVKRPRNSRAARSAKRHRRARVCPLKELARGIIASVRSASEPAVSDVHSVAIAAQRAPTTKFTNRAKLLDVFRTSASAYAVLRIGCARALRDSVSRSSSSDDNCRSGAMNAMHDQMMAGGGGTMMIGFGIVGLLILVALVLAIAALIKYLRAP